MSEEGGRRRGAYLYGIMVMVIVVAAEGVRGEQRKNNEEIGKARIKVK